MKQMDDKYVICKLLVISTHAYSLINRASEASVLGVASQQVLPNTTTGKVFLSLS